MNSFPQLVTPAKFSPRDAEILQNTPRIYLIGDMRAEGPDGRNMLPPYRKTQALLAYLCLSRGERLSRSRVAGKIWDAAGEANARESLRHAMFELGKAGWRPEKDHETVRLDTEGYWIDALETPARPDLLLRSLHGLSSSFDQWVAEERSRFEQRWQFRFEAELAERVDRKAPPDLRIESERKLPGIVETDEAALRHLMVALEERGDGASAIREFERFRLMLESAYQLFPAEPTVMLAETIRIRSRPRLAAAAKSIGETETTSRSAEADTADSEPSIAVLPFDNFAVERRHEYVAAGLVEDLVETISRVPSLFVSSRLSAAAFKQQERRLREIGAALGVRYVLSGSVRIIGERLRLNVELVDTSNDTPLWRSAFDEKVTDLLAMQNRLAQNVVRTVAPQIRSAEVQRAQVKRPEDQSAYELFLRAQEKMHRPSRAEFSAAEDLFKKAIARQPNYAAALAYLAHWHVLRVGQGYSVDPARDTALADRFAQQAIDCDGREPLAIAVRGHIASYLHKDFGRALELFDAALTINPSAARALLWRAYTHSWTVQGARAVEDIKQAMALTPYNPLAYIYSGGASIAYIADQQYGPA